MRAAGHSVRRSTRFAARWATAVAALAVGAPSAATSVAAQQPAADRIRLGVLVAPDTVTVGDPFRVRVRIQAPRGATITFPAAPDTTGAVAARDPRRVDTTAAPDSSLDVTATYTLAAWDVDTQPLGLGDATVRVDGADRRVPLGGFRVFVRSVLPADTALRKPKPPRAPLPDAPSLLVQWWPWLLAALVALALIGWTIVRWLRRRRAPKPPEDAYTRAQNEFARLERLGLIEAGERGRLVALAADVAREYLAARFSEVAPSLTSSEMLVALTPRGEIPHDRLAAFLDHADLVKFAALPVSADAARAGFAEARALVDEIERGVRERLAREAAEAEARQRNARAEQRRYEDEQRRAARGRKAA